MIRKIQKPLSVFAIGLLLFISVLATCTPFLKIQTAQAQTFEQRIPSFGLYCEDKAVIQSGAVKYNLSDAEAIKQGKATIQSSYQIEAVNRTVEFAIPFISSAEKAPLFSITANEQKINTSIWYGNTFFSCDDDTDFESLIADTYSTDIDETVTGTLYTITPDNETISIELSFAEGKHNSFIYDTSNQITAANSADGTNTWTLKNAQIKQEYKFFIVGEITDHSFSCSSTYTTETITCKEFIDRQYEYLKELYDEYGIAVDFLYSIFNRVLQNSLSAKYDTLFFDAINIQRLNVYKFSLQLNAATLINYELPVDIQRNYAFTPTIYLLEQKSLGNYPIRYVAELNEEIPYIIEASAKYNKDGLTYTTETADDYYFVFSSSEKPQSIYDEPYKMEWWRIALFVIAGVAGCVLIVCVTYLIVSAVRNKKHK